MRKLLLFTAFFISALLAFAEIPEKYHGTWKGSDIEIHQSGIRVDIVVSIEADAFQIGLYPVGKEVLLPTSIRGKIETLLENSPSILRLTHEYDGQNWINSTADRIVLTTINEGIMTFLFDYAVPADGWDIRGELYKN